MTLNRLAWLGTVLVCVITGILLLIAAYLRLIAADAPTAPATAA